MYETTQDPTAYAPWEYSTLTEVPALLRFPHAFEGHRHLAVGGVAAGPPGVGGAPSGAAPGSPGVAGLAGGVGAYVAAANAAAARGGADAPSGAGTVGANSSVGGSSIAGGFGAQPLDLSNFVFPSFQLGRFSPAPGKMAIPQKLTDMFFNKQSGGPPPASPTEVPRLPGQGGPLEIPHLTVGQRQGCTTCGGDPNLELRAQRGELERSIKTEQEQLGRQTIEQQREQIGKYQEEEQRGERTTDQEIRDKLALLDQINQEIASQQGITNGAASPTGTTPLTLSGSQPTFLDLLRANLDGFVKDLVHGGECAAVLTKFKVPLPVAGALCLGYQQVKGDVKAITKWAQDLVGPGPQGGVPMVVTPPPPPPPPQAVRFCMNCIDQNSALKFMSGQGSDGCFLEEEDHHHG
jgi:hypothetical protein